MKLGAIGPLSGGGTAWGLALNRGVQMAVDEVNAAGVLLVSNGFNTATLKNDQKAPFNFWVIDTTIDFGPSMVAWMCKAHTEVKKVGLLSPNDATGQAVIPILKAAYEANGFEVWTEVFDRGLQEFTPLLTRMISHGVDLFDINSNSPGDAGLMIKQARQGGCEGLIWQVGGPAVAARWRFRRCATRLRKWPSSMPGSLSRWPGAA